MVNNNSVNKGEGKHFYTFGRFEMLIFYLRTGEECIKSSER